MLMADRSGLGVLELDWNTLSRFLPGGGYAKIQRDWHGMPMTGYRPRTTQTTFSACWRNWRDAELTLALIEMLKNEVGEILRVSPDKTRCRPVPFIDMGLDSLMGVELVVALESRFGVNLPVMDLRESPTIVRLVSKSSCNSEPRRR